MVEDDVSEVTMEVPLGKSDHSIITFRKCINQENPPSKLIRNFSRMNVANLFQEADSTIPWSPNDDASVEEERSVLWEHLVKLINRSSIDSGLLFSALSGRDRVMIIITCLDNIHQATEQISLSQFEKHSSFPNKGDKRTRSAVIGTLLASVNSAGVRKLRIRPCVATIARFNDFIDPGHSLRVKTIVQYDQAISTVNVKEIKGILRDLNQSTIFERKIHEELSVQLDGVLSRDDRLVIKPPLRKTVLEELHKGYMGVENMKSLARQIGWWPEFDTDIYATAKN
ncbi:unnamed protein product [Echinostoma caproni]|uniref:Integrase_H2C2 domain-containing protein n=1 Tax=Echinostoma caproni TaxID=27848 RepID=A0A183AKN9_9TREM|nr:unnamed protein product [Echinostoma caproni]